MLELKCQENARAIAQQIKSSGSGSDVTVTQVVESGTKIATIGVDDVSTDLYAPEVSVTQVLSSGTKIGTIAVGDTSTDLYCETVPTPETPITATGDGVKTYAEILNGLYAEIDSSKVTSSTKLTMVSATITVYATLESADSSTYNFVCSSPGGSPLEMYFRCLIFKSSASQYVSIHGSTVADVSSSAMPSGDTITITY